MEDFAPLYDELAEAPPGGRAIWLRSGSRRVRAALWDGDGRGTVAIFPGRTEYIEKYGRVIAEWRARGFAVAAIDWRGQGLSERALEDPLKGHIEDFAEFQSDVEAFAAMPEIAEGQGPLVLMCHSMGGCIGMRALLDERIRPAATIMSAPMLGIKLSPAMRFGAEATIFLSRRFGFRNAFAPAPNKGSPYVLAQDFDGNVLTGDRPHYGWMQKHLRSVPEFGLAAPTLSWMRAAFDEMAAIEKAPAPAGPMLMLLGDEEDVVEPAAIRAHVAKNAECRLLELPNARHEGLMETPEIRDSIWSTVDGFLGEMEI